MLIMDKVALGQAFLHPNAPFCTCQYHSTSVPYSSSYTCCSYRKEKRPNRGKLSKSDAVVRIGERPIENSLRLVFQRPGECHYCVLLQLSVIICSVVWLTFAKH